MQWASGNIQQRNFDPVPNRFVDHHEPPVIGRAQLVVGVEQLDAIDSPVGARSMTIASLSRTL